MAAADEREELLARAAEFLEPVALVSDVGYGRVAVGGDAWLRGRAAEFLRGLPDLPLDEDEMVDALIRAVEELRAESSAEMRAWDPDRHPRGPGGRFRSTVDVLKEKLQHHHKTGEGDPFEGYSREQLRRVARAHGIELKRGEDRESIAAKLHASLTAAGAGQKAAPAHAGLDDQIDQDIARLVRKLPDEQRDRAARALRIQAAKTPKALFKLRRVEPMTGNMEADHPTAMAVYSSVFRTIHLSVDLDSADEDIDISVRHGVNTKWFSHWDTSRHGSGFDGVVAHEFGHHLETVGLRQASAADQQAFWVSVSHVMQVPPPATIFDLRGWWEQVNSKASGLLSKYGGTNHREFLAEIWAEYSTNPNPRPVAKKIGSMMERLAEEGTL